MLPRLKNARNIKKRSSHHPFSESDTASEPPTYLDAFAKRARVEDPEPHTAEPEVPLNFQDAPNFSEEAAPAPDDEVIKQVHRPQVCFALEGIRNKGLPSGTLGHIGAHEIV